MQLLKEDRSYGEENMLGWGNRDNKRSSAHPEELGLMIINLTTI